VILVEEQGQDVVTQAKELISHGEHQEAIELLEAWLQENPEDVSGWAALGAAHFELENWTEAEKGAREVVRLRPDSARDWCNLGVIFRKLGKLTQAEGVQRHALRLEPQYDRARAELRKILDLASASERRRRRQEYTATPLSWGWKRALIVAASALILLLIWIAGLSYYSQYTAKQAELARRRERARVAVERSQQEEAQRRQEQQAARRRQAEFDAWQEARAREAAESMRINRPVNPRLTVDYMDRYQSPGKGGERLTDAQRKANWEANFEGQRVRWTGTIDEVNELWASYTVNLKCGSTAATSDTRFDVDKRTALSLRKGQRITVEGTLSDHSAFGYRLTEVRIVR